MITTPTAPEPPVLRRLSAFTDDPSGGNPAGVWMGATMPSAAEMLAIAAEVGFSETAFLAPVADDAFRVRYFSPKREISFCGHATVAAGVLLGRLRGAGDYRFETGVGAVPVRVARTGEAVRASLTSVPPEQRDVPDSLLAGALRALGWTSDQLDPGIPPKLAWAGAWHLVLAVTARATLDALDYDYAALERLMLDADLTTLQLVWREDAHTFHARDPFPVGGVVEDPATGAAAAAFGGYLRDAGLLVAPATFTIHQGVAMGRPSRIEVRVPSEGGVTVTGTAVVLDGDKYARVSEPERLAREFLRRVWRAPADLDAIDDLMTDDYVITSAGTVVRGRAQFKEWVRRFHELLDGATNEVLELFTDATGTRAVSRWICRGRSRGVFGLAADGAPVAFSGIAIWTIRDGRLAECWVERSGLEAVRAHPRGARSA
jgi:PhzF family phenazine biosynthesis protein